MKRIEFIAPVEAMRGNLSGRQVLQYAENDNPAYDGPVGSVNYARNYASRFIGAKVARTGKKYFSVRTKTANHLTAKAKKAMALLGGAGALYAALVKVKSTATYIAAQAQYVKLQELGLTKTFRQWVMEACRAALIAKSANITLTGPNAPVTFKNPWNDGSMSADALVSNAILVKFWGELHLNGIYFTIDGIKGIATSEDDFDTLRASGYNVLSLTLDTGGYVRLGSATGAYVMLNGTYAADSDLIVVNGEYTTTTVAPE